MADAALENALARREAISAEIREIGRQVNGLVEAMQRRRSELDELDAFIRMWHHLAGQKPPAGTEQTESPEPKKVKRERPTNPDRRDVAAKCVEYIRAAERPLMRSELFQKLKDDGIVIQGKDPEMVLSTMLWRSKDLIRRLKGGGYWPVNLPPPFGFNDNFEDLLG